jgi:hypothetical protein
VLSSPAPTWTPEKTKVNLAMILSTPARAG